jgi:hypothetical protein
MTNERQKAVQVLFDQLENDELKAIWVSLTTVKPDQLQDRDLRGLALVMAEIARLKMKDRGLTLKTP